MAMRRSASRGFSMAEMLVVLAIIGLTVVVGIPLVSEQFRLAKIRGAADQFAIDLKAARMIAVSKRTTVNMVLYPDPTNRYEYTRTDGALRTIQLPSGVRIVTPSGTTTVAFQPNGSVGAAATAVFEADLSGGVKERWTITTSVLGVSSTTHQRVSS